MDLESNGEPLSELQNYVSDSDFSDSDDDSSHNSSDVANPKLSSCPPIDESTSARRDTNSIVAVKTLLKSDPLDIDMIVRRQEETLCKRRLLLGATNRSKTRRWTKGRNLQSTQPNTIAERWRDYLLTLEDDLFTSPEARTEEEGRVSKGKTSYRGLLLQPENNHDI